MESLLRGILVHFLLGEILVLHIWPHCPFQESQFLYWYAYSQPLFFKIPWFLSNQISNQLKLKLTLCLLLRLFLPTLLDEKKKNGKEKKKKKSIKQGGNHESFGENPHTKSPIFPCIICRGYHFHRECLCIPRILREWSPRSHHPMSSTSGDHVDNTPSTSNSEVHGHKGKVKTPCRLCEGDHTLPRCPFLDETKRFLHNRPASPQQLPPGYKKLSPSPLLIENLTNITQSLVEKPIVESESFESIPDQS